jgi:multicomponent Na+:H+ antiporter subunit B
MSQAEPARGPGAQARRHEDPGGESPGHADPGAKEAREREPSHRRWVGAVLAAGMAVALGAAMAGLPDDHAPLPAVARYAMEVALPKWGLTEPVNEIVYGTRGFDTFGETFLLLAAVVSVILITRSREVRHGYFGESAAGARERARADPVEPADASERAARAADRREQNQPDDTGAARADAGRGDPGRGDAGRGDAGRGDAGRGGAGGPRAGRPDPDDEDAPATPDAVPLGTPAPETAEAMTVVTRTAIRMTLPVLAVGGFYLAAWGYSPGGGFPGGAVLVGVLLLAYAALGRRRIARVIRPGLLEGIELGGATAIIVTELLGLFLRGSVSANWLPLAQPETILSGGISQLFSASELVEVGTGLAIAIFALIGMGHDWTPDERARPDGPDSDSAPDSDGARDSQDGSGS